MGLLDIFKKDKNKQQEPMRIPARKETDDFRIKMTRDGRMIYEYEEAQPKPGQFYDKTQVIVDKTPRIVEGKAVYDCMVAHFNDSDAVMLNEYEEFSRPYQHVIASIDENLMQSDPDYRRTVMTGLLNERRINGYLEDAMKTEEQLIEERKSPNDAQKSPHGRYVGEVIKNNNGKWKKNVNPVVGRALHYDSDMVAERREYQAKIAERRIARQQELRQRMASMQAELDSYEEYEEK